MSKDVEHFLILLAGIAGLVGGFLFGAWCGLTAPPKAPVYITIPERIPWVDSVTEETAKAGLSFKTIASYYAHQFHGKVTASGERFNMHKHTAATRDYPRGWYVIIENLDNGKMAVGRLNDWGPDDRFKERGIDVSLKLAQELGMIESGLAPVKVTLIPNLEGR